MQDVADNVDKGRPQPSWWTRFAKLVSRRDKAESDAAVSSVEPGIGPSKSELDACIAYCRGLVAENAQMRMEIAGLRRVPGSQQGGGRAALQDPDGAASTEATDWEEAYMSLRDENESLRRDNEALLADARGRKRSQYGSRSERVTPEELLVGLRTLAETEPQNVPAGMLEDLEKQCAERARKREERAKKRAQKRQEAVEKAARRNARGGDDDDGGGGRATKGRGDREPSAVTRNSQPDSARVIPIGKGHRNACLVGLPTADKFAVVPAEDRSCPDCDDERQLIGFQDSHMLDLVLPSFRDVRCRQEKLACVKHPDAGVATAPAIVRPIAQGLPTAALLAFIVVAKMEDHLPLERLSGMFRRWGCKLAPSTLAGWFKAAGDLAEPLAAHLGTKVLGSEACLLTDGTNIRVLDPSAPNGSARGGLWGYTVAGVGAWFHYTEDGTYEDTRALLGKRKGPTMTDGHKGYASQRLPDSSKAVPVITGTHLNCLAHARRPFEEVWRLDKDLRAIPVLLRIQTLYAVEAEAKDKGLAPQQRKALRDSQSRPVFNKLFAELVALQAQVTPKSRFGRGIATMLRRQAHLGAYLENGAWPIDNNLQEAQFRSKALGQHNWLFIGAHEAAPRYAALLTLVRSCAMVGVDPVAYLADVFVRMQERGSAKRLDDLLPAAWKKARSPAPERISSAA